MEVDMEVEVEVVPGPLLVLERLAIIQVQFALSLPLPVRSHYLHEILMRRWSSSNMMKMVGELENGQPVRNALLALAKLMQNFFRTDDIRPKERLLNSPGFFQKTTKVLMPCNGYLIY